MKGDFTTYGDTRMMYCNQFITTQQKRCGHVALLFFQLWFNGILRLHGAKTPRSWVLKGMADTAGRLKNHPLLSCWLPSIWFCKCTMGLWVISDSDNPKIVTKSPALSGFLPGVCRGPQSFWEKNMDLVFLGRWWLMIFLYVVIFQNCLAFLPDSSLFSHSPNKRHMTMENRTLCLFLDDVCRKVWRALDKFTSHLKIMVNSSEIFMFCMALWYTPLFDRWVHVGCSFHPICATQIPNSGGFNPHLSAGLVPV